MNLYRPPYKLKQVKVEVTEFCPLICLHCSTASNPARTRQLDEETVNEIIDDCGRLGVEEIVFSGGEPLAWKPIYSALQRCRHIGLRSTIYTTGIKSVDLRDDIQVLARTARESGLNEAILSLHGASSSTHESVTRVARSFDATVCAIEAFRSYGVPCELHFVPLPQNYQELSDLVDLAIKLGIRKLSLLRFVPQGRGSMSKTIGPLSREQNFHLRQNIVDLSEHKKIDIRLGSPYNILGLDDTVDCKAGIDRVIINASGNVYPCDAFKNIDQEGRYGSVLSYPLSVIWEKSEYLNKVRAHLASGHPKVCEGCDEVTRCKSGCLAQKVIRNESYRKTRDPDCLFR